jgi:hypothetical protein
MLRWGLVLLTLAGCGERRKPIAVRGDLGPAVVVVDPRPKTDPTRPSQQLPLVDEKEPDDDVAHAQPLEAGKGVRGTIGVAMQKGKKLVGDEDVYSFVESGEAPDGGFRVARIELGGVPNVDLILEILDGDGKRLVQVNDEKEGKGEVVPNLALEPGRSYFVRVKATQPQKTVSEPYSLTVVSGPSGAGEEREPNDDAPRATPLAAVSDATGYHGRRRDEDWLRLPLDGVAAGSTLKLELSPVEGVAPSIRVEAAGTTVAEARAGRGEELRMRNVGILKPTEASRPSPSPDGARKGDTTYVVIRAAEGRNTDVRWVLRASAEPPLDGAEREPNDTPAKATSVDASSGSARISGFLWPGDADYFLVTGAPAGTLVSASLDGVPRVDLRLEWGSIKADDNGSDKGETLPPLPGGRDLLLKVSARARDTAFDVPYTLTLSTQPAGEDTEVEPNNNATQATVLKGTTARGWLAPKGDEDWFRFTVPDGATKASAAVTAPSGVTLSVRLVDDTKTPLGPALGGGRAAGPVTAGRSYYAVVKASSEKQSNPRDSYTLTVKTE